MYAVNALRRLRFPHYASLALVSSNLHYNGARAFPSKKDARKYAYNTRIQAKIVIRDSRSIESAQHAGNTYTYTRDAYYKVAIILSNGALARRDDYGCKKQREGNGFFFLVCEPF